MKIQCQYCGAMFNDTMEHCPNCGAPNPGVVRTTKSQPLTIAQLAAWYSDRGLPPYETTRFFIGQDYRKPRAFGIYKDENSGNFIVYKNKDNGQRAIRYAGTDEAYAVNELFQRLKQEILEQKSHNIQKRQGSAPRQGSYSSQVKKSAANRSSAASRRTGPEWRGFWGWYENLGCFQAGCFLLLCVILFFSTIVFAVKGYFKHLDMPKNGYYKIEEEYRYCSDWTDGIPGNGWIIYDEETGHWDGVENYKEDPNEELRKNSTAEKYFLSEEWYEGIGCPNFLKSEDYIEITGNTSVNQGYYDYDGTMYYHQGTSRDYGWYEYYDDDWHHADMEEFPEDLRHYYGAQDFWYTPDWSSETQITDFKDSEYYVPPSSSKDDDDDWYNSYDDSSYDWDSSDSWDSGSTDWDSDW